jgi:hypothetical protein
LIQKVTKKSSHQKCFFIAEGFRAQAGKTTGLQSFCGLTCHIHTLHAKSCYALTHFTDLLFFMLFSEAVLLTNKISY